MLSFTETLTFLFTDIEGSTALLQGLGHEAYAAVLAAHHSLIRSGLAAHAGKEVRTQGDGFFAVFSSPSACVSAAIETQRALSCHSWPSAEPVRVRMGIHAGEVEQAATGLVGLEVHRAARVAAVANGGQVLFSSAAAGLVENSLPPGRSLRDLGRHRLKDLRQPGADIPVAGRGSSVGVPTVAVSRQPRPGQQPPRPASDFVGRERELAELRRLVEDGRLVTITGAGGAGKTRLAVQLAAELLDGSGDGVWLVELASVSNEEAVASTILDALRMSDQAGQSPLDILRHSLRPSGPDRARQLRAPHRRLREGRRRHLARDAPGPSAGDQPRAVGYRRGNPLPGAVDVSPRRGRRRARGIPTSPTRSRSSPSGLRHRASALFSTKIRAPIVVDLPAPRRHAARDRAGSFEARSLFRWRSQ